MNSCFVAPSHHDAIATSAATVTTLQPRQNG
jgi:hypothetical protein